MELDTGASRTLISKTVFDSLFDHSQRPPIKATSLILRKYGNSIIPLAGEAQVMARYKGISKLVNLVVTNENGPTLLGRNWIRDLKIDVSNNFVCNSTVKSDLHSRIKSEISVYSELFSEGLGTFRPHSVTIDLDSSVAPRFMKARPVPFALKSKVDEELDRLLLEKVITPIPYSDWACPIVPVVKPNGKIRICGDYKLTANKAIRLDCYPLPKPQELFSTLSGGKYFAKLDMSHAYNQLELDDASKACTTVNTHRGLFRYNRLCFGVSTAPGIFQRTMETLLKGIPRTLAFFDDILISGTSDDDFLSNLHTVLKTLQNAGIRLNKEKCQWCLDEITYLGFKVNAKGIQPTDDKLGAIRAAPAPTNKLELQSYLGLLNFYRMFLPQASTVLEPLNRLLRSTVSWQWLDEQRNAFEKSKELLLSSELLVHFDPSLPIVVSADCSSYGIGACLAHVIDGFERPICFASRTLNTAERNYAQIEREALALVFALKKFHFYIYGHKFVLKTDHKPLLGLFSPDKAIPAMASGRIQRWCLMLQAYHFQLVHTSGKLLGNVDALSRLPPPVVNEMVPIPAEWVNLVQFLNSTPVNANSISKATAKDKLLSQVYSFCINGWPQVKTQDLQPYFMRREELTVQGGCVLWGIRVLVPSVFRSELLAQLHSEHVGATRMKQLARSYLWWPGLDKDIECLVQTCEHCLQCRHAPPSAELHPWSWPDRVWHRIHIDYCGPMKGFYYLIIVDATSKWVEIFKTQSITSSITISFLRSCFARFGIPVTLVSDNAPNFTSTEFLSYLESLGVRHLPTAIYSPHMNGLAERMVETFKDSVQNFEGERDIQAKIDKFLLKYRITPHTVTGVSPAELMFSRNIRTVFDLLRPSTTIADRVARSQEKMKRSHSRPRQLNLNNGDRVLVRNFAKGLKWSSGRVQQKTGRVTYKCQMDDGAIVMRHQNQLWKDHRTSTPSKLNAAKDRSSTGCTPLAGKSSVPPQSVPVSPLFAATPQEPSLNKSMSSDLPLALRRTRRDIHPPTRLNL